MVQKSSGPGRPLAFDREAALDAAMNLFWQGGFAQVGMAELERGTGLNRSSLYNTFGSKEALFTRALDRYSERTAAPMLRMLRDGAGGLEDLAAFIEALKEYLSLLAGKGCFMVNTMADGPEASSDIATEVRRYVDRFLDALRAVLRRAVSLGELQRRDAEEGAHLILGAVLAANLLARARQPEGMIDSILDAAIARVRPGGAARGVARGSPRPKRRTITREEG